ncbi:hypothetical protein AURDEDRAFT_116243 [Auricularia subglabra TFB-10046 SS5]|nr:hypothetical protein AURDEDRAFT_116243 [Auricularia subglabra TFB-10046 SS5]
MPASASLPRHAPSQEHVPTVGYAAHAVSTTLPQQHVPRASAPSTFSNHGKDAYGPSSAAQGPASTVVASGTAQVAAPSGQQPAEAGGPSNKLDQPKRRRANVGDDAPPSKRPAISDSWQARSALDSLESSVPVGHHVQTGNNLVSPQRSRALQMGRPEVGEAAPFTALADHDLEDEPIAASGPAPVTAHTSTSPMMQADDGFKGRSWMQ